MKKYLLILLLCLKGAFVALAQSDSIQVSGTIKDENNEPMIGVNIVIKDHPGLGAITDVKGNYKIKAQSYDVLSFTYIGYDKQDVPIKGRRVINVKMQPSDDNVLDEVTVTGTGIQKKATVTGAITTVDVDVLKNATGANISIANTLAGNVAGIIAQQTSGEPGRNTSTFWIRGISTFGAGQGALVLVDGFERSMNEINIEDIQSFSVLKDASATAIYGSRGANGVVLITTKQGHSGKVNINARVETTYNTRTRTPEYVGAYDYAQMMNEALITRNREPRYTPKELEIIRMGLDPDLYPNVNWMDVLLKDGAWAERATLDISGGGSNARYYLSGSYNDTEGMYKTDKTLREQYNTNSNQKRWNYRMNTEVNVTKTTLIRVGVAGSLTKQTRPGQGDNVWASVTGQSPISIPVMYSNGFTPSTSREDARLNPWITATQTGYEEYWENRMQSNISLEQDLKFITKGLKFIGRFGFDTYNWNSLARRKRPAIYTTEPRRDQNGNLIMIQLAPEQTMTQTSNNSGNRNDNLEAELHYDRTFKQIHQINAMFKYSQREVVVTQNVGDDIMRAISRRNQGYSGRLLYGLMGRYFAEFNFGYTGSENFSKGHQFGFFPAASVGWNIAEEKFVKNIFPWMEMFKIRYSYGKVGNDEISQRFPYLTYFGDWGSWNYGDYLSDYTFTGYHYSQVASPGLSWETAKKHNIGLDVSIFNGSFTLTLDIFKDTREGIFMQRTHLPEIIGLASNPWENVGRMQSTGVDGNFMFHRKMGEFNLTVRGNLTVTKNKVLDYDEETNAYPYQMTRGFRWNQERGLVAEGLFKDYEEIRTSPRQFGEYAPGDIKYKDINGDGIINNLDEVPIGATRTPCTIYGLGASLQWKGFDVNIHFQGAGKSSYALDGPSVYPFSEGGWGNISVDLIKPGNRWISKDISGDPATENPNAKYPRLSYGGNSNNYRKSTFWMRNGAYLRLKTVEIGYTLPKSITRKLLMSQARFYVMGSNLAVWDHIKLWDPELTTGNGNAYPLTKSVTMGLTVNF